MQCQFTVNVALAIIPYYDVSLLHNIKVVTYSIMIIRQTADHGFLAVILQVT